MLAALPATCTSTWCSSPRTAAVFNTQMLNLCEQVMAQVCTNFDATLAEFNGTEDHVHLLVQYPPKVALSHNANSLKDV